MKGQQKRRGLIVEEDPRATIAVGNTHGQGIEENSEEKEALRQQMQADDGFEFEDSTQEAAKENGMSIHQRLAARISKQGKDESYGRDALLQAVLQAEQKG